MKKNPIIFTAIAAALVVAIGALGGFAIYRAEQQEVMRVQNIAGAVVSQFPEAENTLAQAATDQQLEDRERGSEIMASYGYDDHMSMRDNYRKALTAYIAAMAALLIFLVGSATAFFAYMTGKRRRQEETVVTMLDDCLSEDYGFIDDESRLRQTENPHFADTLVKLAQSLKIKTDRLNEERDNTKTMVTDISHQLKTPISAMKVCFDMYLEARSEEEKKEFLSRSMIQMDKLENLAAALINISRLENKMIELTRENVQLSELLLGAVNSEYHKAAAKDISLEVEDFEDMTLCMDRKWTVEAVANVIDNGIKYSTNGTCISITATRMFSFVRIEIADQGIGIPKEERNKIFMRFFRGSSDTVKEQEGSGVGLYLTRKILGDQGGTVSVRSGKDAGSVFVLQMPL